jgi:ABC-type multidrug transport system fused ATPase/permease subunit
VRGEVVFEDVQFAYRAPAASDAPAGGAPPVIAALNLRLVPGQVVAMLGATGVGKSTIAKLIARFYDPTAGRVLLDGIDLRDLADRDLRRAVTMLTQEGFLFAGSVADNIRISRPSATLEEVTAAARAMGADAMIRALPEGYATDVRKRGSRLSAGQRQMIAFARAFLADPAVLILDEATSALDIPTERATQAALRKLLLGRTALVIAHRLATVAIADRVLVVSDGRIVDDGAPAELLAKGSGEFASLYRDGHGLSLHPADG